MSREEITYHGYKCRPVLGGSSKEEFDQKTYQMIYYYPYYCDDGHIYYVYKKKDGTLHLLRKDVYDSQGNVIKREPVIGKC